MTESRITPLQDAVERLRWGLLASTSAWLAENDPHLLGLIEEVTAAGDADHVEPPVLDESERQPEDIPAEGIFDSIFGEDGGTDRLKDVWSGRGDTGDGAPWASNETHDQVMEKLREDPETNWVEATPK